VRRLEWPPERRGQESVSARRRGGQQKKRRPQQWQRQQELVLFPGSCAGARAGRSRGTSATADANCQFQYMTTGAAMSDQGALGEKRELAAKVLRDVLERMGVDAEVSAF